MRFSFITLFAAVIVTASAYPGNGDPKTAEDTRKMRVSREDDRDGNVDGARNGGRRTGNWVSANDIRDLLPRQGKPGRGRASGGYGGGGQPDGGYSGYGGGGQPGDGYNGGYGGGGQPGDGYSSGYGGGRRSEIPETVAAQ